MRRSEDRPAMATAAGGPGADQASALALARKGATRMGIQRQTLRAGARTE